MLTMLSTVTGGLLVLILAAIMAIKKGMIEIAKLKSMLVIRDRTISDRDKIIEELYERISILNTNISASDAYTGLFGDEESESTTSSDGVQVTTMSRVSGSES